MPPSLQLLMLYFVTWTHFPLVGGFSIHSPRDCCRRRPHLQMRRTPRRTSIKVWAEHSKSQSAKQTQSATIPVNVSFAARRLRALLKPVLEYAENRQPHVIVLLFYLFHLTVLTQREWVFPYQLIPSKKGHFTGVGWDSLSGMFSIVLYQVVRRRRQRRYSQRDDDRDDDSSRNTSAHQLAPLMRRPGKDETPWNLPRDNSRFRLTSVVTVAVLVNTYFATGRFSIFWEDTLYNLSGLGFPITAPMHRSLCVLLGHLSWLLSGALLLRWLPRPPKFFQPANHEENTEASEEATSDPKLTKNSRPYVWFQSSHKSKWLWWVIGGFFVSGWLFNISDVLNQYILPESVLEEAQESVVSQLVSPEHNDWLASLVGYVAPCITAPWWEEVLYRGFALPALAQTFGYRWAVFLQGIIFSAHHMSLAAALPLAVLGWTWAVLYTKSRNLWVVVAVHSLWNARIFIGSWLGL